MIKYAIKTLGYFLIALSVALLMVYAVSANADDELAKAFKAVAPSVGALYTIDDGGDMKFICTATAVESEEEESVFLSAGHCARDNQAYLISFNGSTFHKVRVWKVPPEIKDRNYKRPFGEPRVDMAFFKSIEKLDIKTISIEEEKVVVAGHDVITLGYPLGVTKVGYSGTVAGIYTRLGELNGYIMLQIFGAPGSSGSAIIDPQTNRIVGVLVSGKQGRAGLPVIFATPMKYNNLLVSVDEDKEKKEDKVSE